MFVTDFVEISTSGACSSVAWMGNILARAQGCREKRAGDVKIVW
jgi:hypothetical protein